MKSRDTKNLDRRLVIGNRIYRFVGEYYKKREAQAKAEVIRARGGRARIVSSGAA